MLGGVGCGGGGVVAWGQRVRGEDGMEVWGEGSGVVSRGDGGEAQGVRIVGWGKGRGKR